MLPRRLVQCLARLPPRNNMLDVISLRTYSAASNGAIATEKPIPQDKSSSARIPQQAEPIDQTNASSRTGTTTEKRELVLQNEEESLPPLAFEPGIVGVAQKGVSAVVIAFGLAALGACMWGASQALFPSATRYAI